MTNLATIVRDARADQWPTRKILRREVQPPAGVGELGSSGPAREQGA
jgi:hypothetical protein